MEENVKLTKEELNNSTIVKNISYDQKEILYNIMQLHNGGKQFDCDITASTEELTDDYKLQIISTHKEKAKEYFSKQIDKCKSIPKYSEIKFHLILFPVPDKRKIVERFIKRAKELRDE